MDRRQDNQTLLVNFDESIKRVILELIELDLFSDSLNIENNGRIAHEHLEGHLSKLFQECYNSLIHMRRLIRDRENGLDFAHQCIMRRMREALIVNCLPV